MDEKSAKTLGATDKSNDAVYRYVEHVYSQPI